MTQIRKVAPNSIGCDISEEIYQNSPFLISGLEENLDIYKVRGDGTDFLKNKFDCIISNQVLEHVFDHEQILVEMDWLLNSQGQLILCFPPREIIMESHLKLPLVHRLKKRPYLLKLYLSFAHFFRLGQVRHSKKILKDWVSDRTNYLHKHTNYIKARDFFHLLDKYQFEYDDISEQYLKDRFQLNWLERKVFSIVGAHRVVGLLLVCNQKNE